MPSRPKLVALVSLVLGTLLVHSPALSNGFLNWDDGEYLRAVAGFDAWDLLTEPVLGLHHPLTLASLALERAVFGEEPFWFHLSNVLLHTGCTVLVYVVVERLRGDREGDRKDAGAVAFGCAALFAVHPMHVESVAWVAERKDVLSTLLYLGALAVWLGGRQPLTAARLAGVFALFVAALLAKPMAVTLPLVLVALAIRTGAFPRRTLLAMLPFFAVALLAGWLNLGAQEPIHRENVPIYAYGLAERLWIGAEAFVFYVSKSLLPLGLSSYYDLERVRVGAGAWLLAAGATSVLLAVGWRRRRHDPNVLFGLAFFAITIAPVLKVLPFGEWSIFNDRYTYLPSVGLFLAVLAPLGPLLVSRRRAGNAAWGLLVLVLLAFSVASYQRAQVFESSETFWGDVLSTYPGTPLALNSLGRHLLDEADDVDRAQALFEEALRERPDYALPHYNLGVVYERRGDEALARESYEKALELAPRDVTNRISVARFHSRVGDTRRAIEHYEVAVEHDPESLVAWYNLGLMHAKLSRFEAAKRALRRATLVAPDFGGSYASLGAIARVERRPKDALALYEQAKAAGHPVSRQILEGLRAELDALPGAAP